MEPIAIARFSFRLPQDAEDLSLFWNMLEAGRNVKEQVQGVPLLSGDGNPLKS
jgi:acyl transferase domain-containing protein